jgi:hypothetical protein
MAKFAAVAILALGCLVAAAQAQGECYAVSRRHEARSTGPPGRKSGLCVTRRIAGQ